MSMKRNALRSNIIHLKRLSMRLSTLNHRFRTPASNRLHRIVLWPGTALRRATVIVTMSFSHDLVGDCTWHRLPPLLLGLAKVLERTRSSGSPSNGRRKAAPGGGGPQWGVVPAGFFL